MKKLFYKILIFLRIKKREDFAKKDGIINPIFRPIFSKEMRYDSK